MSGPKTHAPETLNRLEFAEPALGATLRYTRIASPVGELLLVSDGSALCGLYLGGAAHVPELPIDAIEDAAPFSEARRQLEEYFAGTRLAFELAVAPVGTAFQRSVWRALATIAYGTTASYAAIAATIGQPKASRAVGAANGRNPISIVVPCHRVIGANGSLTGYAGGVARKEYLLQLEQRNLAS